MYGTKKPFVLLVVALVLFSGEALAARRSRSNDGKLYLPPERVRVLPVFLVPRGEQPPNMRQMVRLMQHVRWAQKRFGEMLGGRDTFEIADTQPHVYRGGHSLAYYRKKPQNCAPYWMSELLQHYNVNRFNCPYVFVVVVMNSRDGFPGGGGRPINGGLNTGGGVVIVSSHGLMKNNSNFQSTLEHELGHAFGLLHVDAYGYDMKSNASIMSYNKAHHTKGLTLSKTPGALIPEDIRALALNRRVFARLKFDPTMDVPKDYAIKPHIPCMGPMTIPGQPDSRVRVKTSSGETDKSSVSCVVGGKIKSSRSRFDPKTMWASSPTTSDWVSVELEFPMPVRISKITVYSLCTDRRDPAHALEVQAKFGNKYRTVAHDPLNSINDSLSFRPTESKDWRLFFKTGQSKKVVLRGLRFFSGDAEIFPPLLPRFADSL